MNKSGGSSKQSSSSSNTKSKKNAKDRDKRKAQLTETNNQQNSTDILGISQNTETTKGHYAGIGQDQLRIYAEHVGFETEKTSKEISNDVWDPLAEDLTYKLRYVIHDALTRARLSARNVITSQDIEDTFESLRLEKVYGAPANPNWGVVFDKQALYYLEDPTVNLFEIAEEEISYLQPADVVITRKWLPDLDDIEEPMKNYFTIVCESVVSKNLNVRCCALQDISSNPKIGPIIDWFYNFAYFLLSNHVASDYVTLRALDLIQALEENPVAGLTVAEKTLSLLVRLILQKLFSKFTTSVTLKQTCNTLAALCTRLTLRELAATKILLKVMETKDFNLLHVLSIINAMGLDVIELVFVEYMQEFIPRIIESEAATQHEVMSLYRMICRDYSTEIIKLHEAILQNFRSWLPIFWKPLGMQCGKAPTRLEMNMPKVKANLIRTRQKIKVVYKERAKIDITSVFTETKYNKKIFLNARNIKMVNGYSEKQQFVTIGKLNLQSSIPKYFNYKPTNQICDHSIFYIS